MNGGSSTIEQFGEIPYADPAEIRESLAPKVSLIIQPGIVKTWEDFSANAPENSIAIDGFVEGPVQRDLERQVVNLNHHERVDRSTTYATCQQAVSELRRGLLGNFSQDGEFTANVFMNDCDEDVCSTVFALTHPRFAAQIDNPAFNRLIEMEGIMDMTGGFYPWPEYFPSLREFFWVYEPYSDFRNSGGLSRQNPEEYRAVIDQVGERITRHITGQGESIELDTRYEVIAERGTWKMIREVGKHAKVGMLSDGIKAYTSVTSLGEGKYKYSNGRLSPYVPFDVQALHDRLNEIEAKTEDDSWGGGDTIGGSPRLAGSRLTPDQMIALVPGFIKPN